MQLVLMMIAALLALTTPATAGRTTMLPAGVVLWQSTVGGVEFEVDSAGVVVRVAARRHQTVPTLDRQGALDAQVMAEKSAGEAIEEFLQEGLGEDDSFAAAGEQVARAAGGLNADAVAHALSRIAAAYREGRLGTFTTFNKGFDPLLDEGWASVGLSGRALRNANH